MMTLWDIFLIALALAMDCFTVSIVYGVVAGNRKAGTLRWGNLLRMALLFGLFQAVMPLLGWLGIHRFSAAIEAYDHWIAFGMLALIGGKMIFDAFGGDETPKTDPTRLRTQVVLAVATSIDALAVGISMGCSGYEALPELALPLLIIGVISLVMSIFGAHLGRRFGQAAARRFRPELIGGLILVGIGIKILLEHLLG